MSWLVANTLVAAALALVVLLVGRLRPAPAVMHGLWLFVLLKLVTPPLFVVPVDLGWWRGEPASAQPAVVPWDLATADLGLVDLQALTRELAGLAAAPVSAPTPRAQVGTAPRPWTTLALAAWGLGAAAMLAWFAAGLWRGHRRLLQLGPVPPALRREIEALAGQLGVRAPALCDDPAAGSPYVWSFGRTVLVVPVRTLAAASAKGRAAVLAHELAHLRRGDHWLAHGELLLAVVLWWHPLFWFARARLRLWAELACDAWAVASVPDATLDYATVLVDAVARPDSAVPAPAVLAARPAARAAFERRLTMILNENVPCRASRAWWLPFTSLALGLFTVPVAAQEVQDPVRVEIRVNGKQVDELSAAERKALLRRLLEAEEKVDQAPEPRPAKKADKKPAKKPDPKPKKARVQVDVAADDVHDGQARHEAHGDMPSAKQMHEMMRAGLAEARAEIEGDADLRELGITDEVGRLIDDVAAGKGMGGSLDAVIKAAMKGAGRMVEKELAADEDLRAMGLTDGITRLVRGMLENERTQEMMGEFVQRTMERAMKDAKLEIRATPELQELGIAVDVEGLLDSVLSGKGDFDAKLQTLIEKAMAGAHKLHGGAHGHDEGAAAEPVAPKKKARKAKLELR